MTTEQVTVSEILTNALRLHDLAELFAHADKAKSRTDEGTKKIVPSAQVLKEQLASLAHDYGLAGIVIENGRIELGLGTYYVEGIPIQNYRMPNKETLVFGYSQMGKHGGTVIEDGDTALRVYESYNSERQISEVGSPLSKRAPWGLLDELVGKDENSQEKAFDVAFPRFRNPFLNFVLGTFFNQRIRCHCSNEKARIEVGVRDVKDSRVANALDVLARQIFGYKPPYNAPRRS